MKTKTKVSSSFFCFRFFFFFILPFSFFPTTHRAPSLPHHPWAVSQNPINFVYFSFAPLYHPRPAQPQPHPMPCHAMPCPPKKKETVLPPGPFYTVDRVTYLPPYMKPATKYGEEKNRSHPSRWYAFDGRLVASASSMALFLFFL